MKTLVVGILMALAVEALCDVNTEDHTPSKAPSFNEENVLVTANLRSQDAASLPISWAQIDAASIELTRHIHINELMQQVSGAWLSRGNGQEALTALRSPVLTGAGGCGSFYMAADGIALRAPGFCNVNQLFDANSEQAGKVEVIKGPANAAYGSNAMHGVINILSEAPPESSEQRYGIDAGGFGYTRGRFSLGNTWSNHGLRFSGNVANDEGYKDDAGFEQQKFSVRHDYNAEKWQAKTDIEFSNLNQETAGFIEGERAYEESDSKRENPNPEAYRDAHSFRASSAISFTLDSKNSLEIKPFIRSNEMAFMMHFVPWKPVEENGHDSLGLRTHWLNQGETYTLTSGIDLDFTQGWLKETQYESFSPNQPEGKHYDYQVDALNSAVFTQLELAMGARTGLTMGLRLDSMHYDYHNNVSSGNACDASASACRFYRPESGEDNFENASFNLGLNVNLSDSTVVYTRLARGFRAPQTSELYRLQSGQEEASLESEQMDSVDIGARGEISSRFSYDASVYLMNKANVIFQDANRHNVSGAETEHYGLDFSFSYQLNQDINWALNGTVARHKYASSMTLLGVSTDIKGNDIDTAPRSMGSTRINWAYAQNSLAELEWIVMASYYVEPENLYQYGGHNLLNFRLSHSLSSLLKLGIRINNVLDQDYAERADFGFGNYRYFVGEPRAYYASLDYSF